MQVHVDRHRFMYLDFLRYICASIVIFAHGIELFLIRIYGRNGTLDYFQSWFSDMAVIFFFILSGYVIAYSVDIQLMQNCYSLSGYIKKRFIRIYPVAWGAILLACLAILIMYIFNLGGLGWSGFYLVGDLYTEPNYISYFSFINTLFLIPHGVDGGFFNVALWSLPYEFGLYLIYGVIVALITKFGYKKALFLLICIVIYLVLCYDFNSNMRPYLGLDFLRSLKDFPSFDFTCLAVTWFYGVCLFYLTKNKVFQIKLCVTLIIIAGLVTYFMYKVGGVELFFRMYPKTGGQTIMLWGYSLVAMLCIYCLLFIKHTNKIVEIIAALGQRYSYSLYAIHFVILNLSFSILMPLMHKFNLLGYIGVIIVCFIVANFVAYYFSMIFENKQLWVKILFPSRMRKGMLTG